MKTLTSNDYHFIISALNAYWNEANASLSKPHLGDIERAIYERQLKRSKEIMKDVEEIVYS